MHVSHFNFYGHFFHRLPCSYYSIDVIPAGEPSTSPRFRRGFMGEFQGITPAEISSRFPCGNEEQMKGYFLCGYFQLLSLWNPWGYFRVEISHVLPSKILNCNLMTWERSQLCEKYPSDDLRSFFGELKCLQLWGNFPLICIRI